MSFRSYRNLMDRRRCQCTDRRIDSKETLIFETAQWQNRRNALEVPVDWQFTTADARIKLKRLYPSIGT